MSILSELATILHNDFLCEKVCFKEKDAGMKIEVDNSGCQCLIYKYDKKLGKEYKGGLFPFFAKTEGVCKVSDYIVFSERKGVLYVLIVELKRGKAQTFPQLLAAKEFVKYVIATLNRVNETSYVPEIRLISIHGINIRKKKTQETGIKYDEQSHCCVKSNRFNLKMYLI